MTDLIPSRCVVLALVFAACQDASSHDLQGAAASGHRAQLAKAAKATAAGESQIANADIAGYQRDLLKFAFEAASKFPSNPHSKNRGRAQDLVVAACFRMQQPLQALAFAPHVEGFDRGVAYADFAWCCAKVNDQERTHQYIELAQAVIDELGQDTNAQQWRADKVGIKIARALATLGEHDEAQKVLAKVSPSSSGAVDESWTGTMAERIAAMSLADAEQELLRITDTFLSQVMGEQYTSLMLLSGMHGQFFENKEMRATTEERLFVRFNKLPTTLRLDAMAPLVGHYVAHKDLEGARDVIVKMTDLMGQFKFRTEDRIPQLARIIELRVACGDEERARAEMQAALQDYNDNREEIVNIYRCETLRPLALAWHAMGESAQANDLIALALEEALENPNSRPRCDDLVETCVAMAERGLEPSAELWARMREISKGLSNPW